MPAIMHPQGNASQNHHEMPPHTHQDGLKHNHFKKGKEQVLVRMWELGPHTCR